MVNDYEQQRASIVGKAARRNSGGEKMQQGPWKSKEKQSLLFNTAPVFSPDAGVMKKDNVELAKLSKMYDAATDKIAGQKRNAIEWIRRQESRMRIQMLAIVEDRKVIAPFLREQEEDFERFSSICREIVLEAGGAGRGGKTTVGEATMARTVGGSSGGSRGNNGSGGGNKLFDDSVVANLTQMRLGVAAGTGGGRGGGGRIKSM